MNEAHEPSKTACSTARIATLVPYRLGGSTYEKNGIFYRIQPGAAQTTESIRAK